MNEKQGIIESLRKEINKFQPLSGAGSDKCTFGIDEIDQSFPLGAFPTGAVHELICDKFENAACTATFLAGVLSSVLKASGPIVWVTNRQNIYPLGFTRYGLLPDQIIFICANSPKNVLWSMNEALRTKGLQAVIGDISDIDLNDTRRLQIAVEDSGVTGFLFRTYPKEIGNSACAARWVINPLPSSKLGLPGIGRTRWDINLTKIKNGSPKRWNLEWRKNHFELIKPKFIENVLNYKNVASA